MSRPEAKRRAETAVAVVVSSLATIAFLAGTCISMQLADRELHAAMKR